MQTHKNANSWLLNVYEARCRTNPKYSLRAFAQFLRIPPGRLSEIFRDKRPITVSLASKIADRLALTPSRRSELFELIQTRSKKNSLSSNQENQTVSQAPYRTLTEDQFHIIADWYHYAILSLFEVKEFRPSTKWMGQRLGISSQIVTAALDRLERLNLIRRTGPTWQLTGRRLATTEDIASPALRRSHKQSLEQAISALDAIPVELRDISSITMAIDPKNIQKAKLLIRKFRNEFASQIEGCEASEVYNLNIQYVPVNLSIKNHLNKN